MAKTIDNKPSVGVLYYRHVSSVNLSNLDGSGTFVLFYNYDNHWGGRW
ncbi:unnamed protein product [marine sediment metagenome]|uniref:Uncharacterized protein n=1 Tax=marine sediment metagenome TaxID=412755 RepID=X1TAR0_9ZZZZ